MSHVTRDTEPVIAAIGDRLRLAHLARPRTTDTTRIAIVADPHVATQSSGTYRVYHRTEERLETAIETLNERDLDLVIFPGDLTKDGEPWNYDRVEDLLQRLDHPSVVIPGNHDVQKRTVEHRCPTPETFADRFKSESPPFRIDVAGLSVFVLDSTSGPDGPYADTHRGAISPDQLEWLDDTLEDASTSVVVTHHNPLPIVAEPLCLTDTWRPFTMRNRASLLSVLARHDVPLVLAGHHHVPSLVQADGLTQLLTPATAMYPQAHCELEIDERGTDVWLVSHASASERAEAYDLAASGPRFRRLLLELTRQTLEDAPITQELRSVEPLGERAHSVEGVR